MSAVPKLAPVSQAPPRRNFLRYPINVPLDVIMLRSGIPDSVPGRCTDLSEGGVGAVMAGELAPGQQVGIELRLPNVGVPVRARALVRYHDRLHCGLQFTGISPEQCSMIRYWAYKTAPASVVSGNAPVEASIADSAEIVVAPQPQKRGRRIRINRRHLYALLLAILTLGILGWWEWQRAWRELEMQASAATEPQVLSPLRVSPETMEQRIVYKLDPIYPEAARLAKTQGLVVLDAVIASDGSVKRLRTVSGPDLLARSALDAVQSWKFRPYIAGGEAVEVETTVAVEFLLE